ncbi:hypothetical protein QBC41DRAFT_382246 [Cercophora samala]|uniref:Uncharacterized protein n=1 Tax=Cercophora samala TaxID=330535 RepID=A0AA39Z0T5_9PEZI|nr:hypothetical protein QBC41DRAFT_382246 [Cercophora samala]
MSTQPRKRKAPCDDDNSMSSSAIAKRLAPSTDKVGDAAMDELDRQAPPSLQPALEVAAAPPVNHSKYSSSPPQKFGPDGLGGRDWCPFRDEVPDNLEDAAGMAQLYRIHLDEIVRDEADKNHDIEYILSPEPLLRKLLRQHLGSRDLATRLKLRIHAVGAPLYEKVFAGADLYNSTLSQELAKFVPLLDSLSRIEDEHAFKESYKAAMLLKSYWWCPGKSWSQTDRLPWLPDPELERFDDLLEEIIACRKEREPAWDVQGVFEQITMEWLARRIGANPQPWFDKTRQMLRLKYVWFTDLDSP